LLTSVETRRRLLRKLPDIAIGAVVLGVLGYFFVLPLVHRHEPQVAPPFKGTTLNGKPFSIMAERGHILILDFFATWCGPCRDSLPYVEHFAATEPSVHVVAVDQGEEEKLVRDFVRQYHMGDTVVDYTGAVAKAYNVTGLPTLIAVDDQGKIRNIWVGYSSGIERQLHAAVRSYEILRRSKNAAMPLRPS
jgi:cytochrome c biogenesis protein CcmG/thiol:disulfide interchange protein DsbE